MSLSPEQKQAVAAWVAAGDNLSVVQKKLSEQFKLSLTYRDVRFLVDDLNLDLKDAAPKVDASDVTKTPPAPPPRAAVQPETSGQDEPGQVHEAPADAAQATMDDEGEAGDEDLEDLPAGASSVTVDVDSVTLIPGALASGTVKFSDGVTAKWVVDQYGRPGFTEVSQPGYRPSPADGQAFMRDLSRALQQRGF